MLHNSRVECFLVLDLQVLRVLQNGKREADKAGRHKKLIIRPVQQKSGFYSVLAVALDRVSTKDRIYYWIRI
jgi:hypothetical protein